MKTSCQINLLEIGCLMMLVYTFIVVNKNKIYCNLKDIDMSISPTEKFIILTEDVALLTKKFHGNEGKFGKIYMVCLMFLQLTKFGK